MKKLLIIPLLLINGCSTYSLLGDLANKQPQTKPVEVVSVAKRSPIYHPPLPEPIEASEEPRVAFYGLTSQGYENLSMNMGEIKRYLEQILHIVGYYRDIDEEDEE